MGISLLRNTGFRWKNNLFARIGIVALAILVAMLTGLFYYLSHSNVITNNKAKQITAELTSQALLDKLDRNFYERFGDVQAFAYNRLAVAAATNDTSSHELQDFMNTMTAYYVLYDLMMIVNMEGKVIAVNTTDKQGQPINSMPLAASRQDFSRETWFRACVSGAGPEGGAWYSDFTANPEVARIYGGNGYGLGFAAPIRNQYGQVLGVWYNFASWKEITGDIRSAAEEELLKNRQKAHVLLTRTTGEIIDATNPALVAKRVKMEEPAAAQDDTDVAFLDPERTYGDYVAGWATAQGAYTYKGNRWRAVTLMPRERMHWAILLNSEMRPALLIIIAVVLGLGWLTVRFFRANIIDRITKIQNALESMASGRIIMVDEEPERKDELARIAHSLGHLAESINQKVLFSNEIAKGNLEAELSGIAESDVLGQSLVNMRGQLKQTAQADRQRIWVSEGLAKMMELVRANLNMDAFCEQALAYLIHYLQANQGAVFVKDEGRERVVLEMKACYAYGRKKHLMQEILPGEGLTGQVFLEGQPLYMTDIPDEYLRITSGLGEANPRCVLIVPLRHNMQTEGILEIASFRKMEAFEIEFVRLATENIAAAITMAKTNETTTRLLVASQKQSEELRAAEEEMRQNMEEMQATQEEMERKEMELQKLLATSEKLHTD